jgi:WD40 repeat protein
MYPFITSRQPARIQSSFKTPPLTEAARYKVDIESLEPLLLSEHPAAPVVATAFDPSRPDVVHSIDAIGVFRSFSLSDYTVLCKGMSAGQAVCMCSATNESACGYADGTVRAFTHGSGASSWTIPKAHRGAVTAITCDAAFWYSGGEDGAVRLWTKQSRLFVSQFQEHSKAVTGLIVDVVNPQLLHSCSLDRSVISYNIKENKRCNYHLNKAAGTVQ